MLGRTLTGKDWEQQAFWKGVSKGWGPELSRRSHPRCMLTSGWGPPAWCRDFCGSCSEMPLPSRLVRLLRCDPAILVPRGWGGLLGPGGAASALSRPRRDPSLAADVWKPAGFTDPTGSTVSLAGRGRDTVTLSPGTGAVQPCPGSHTVWDTSSGARHHRWPTLVLSSSSRVTLGKALPLSELYSSHMSSGDGQQNPSNTPQGQQRANK